MKVKIEVGILFLLLVSCIFSFVYTQFTIYIVDLKFYLGFLSIVVTLLINIKFVKLSKILLGVILLLGSFNFLQFTHYDFEMLFEITQIIIVRFNPIILFLLILFVLTNGSAINKFVGQKKEKPKDEEIKDKENNIKFFIRQFKDKTVEELKSVVDNSDSYVGNAVIASQRLIEEKENCK